MYCVSAKLIRVIQYHYMKDLHLRRIRIAKNIYEKSMSS